MDQKTFHILVIGIIVVASIVIVAMVLLLGRPATTLAYNACGNGLCNYGENCSSCPSDCGACLVGGSDQPPESVVLSNTDLSIDSVKYQPLAMNFEVKAYLAQQSYMRTYDGGLKSINYRCIGYLDGVPFSPYSGLYEESTYQLGGITDMYISTLPASFVKLEGQSSVVRVCCKAFLTAHGGHWSISNEICTTKDYIWPESQAVWIACTTKPCSTDADCDGVAPCPQGSTCEALNSQESNCQRPDY